MNASPDIFLSYNREDAEVARRFAEGIEAQGFEVWWDVDLRSGEAYDKVTEAALRGAKAVVVLWSPRSVDSRWVRAEASIADENGTLVPALIEACSLPVMFRLTQTPDLTHWQGAAEDKAWLAFLDDVRRMVGNGAAEQAAKPSPAPAPAGSGIPIVAVLPITHRGGGEEMEFLAEDLTEEITRELSRSKFCKVTAVGIIAAWRGKVFDYFEIGQKLGARYLTEGKLQRSGETIRLTMQIIDTATGEMPWTKRFVRKPDEVETSPDELAAAVGSELHAQIYSAEIHRVKAKPGPWSGWEHFMRAAAYSGSLGSDSVPRAIAEARQAVAKAPDLGPAHAILESYLGLQVIVEACEFEDALRQEIQEHITRALQSGGDDPTIVTWLVTAYAGLGDGETALRLARRVTEFNPNIPASHLILGFACEMEGRTEDAIAAYERSIRLTTNYSSRYQIFANLGRCYLLEGRPEEAAATLDQSLALIPNWHTALKWKAITAAQLGDERAALAAVRRLREVEPTMSIDHHVRQIMTYTGLRDRLAEPVATLRRLWDETEDGAKST